MGVVKLAFLLILYTAIPTFILLCTPGLPPDMKFEAYEITPALKLEGKLAPNNKLDKAEALHDGEFEGPESVAIRNDDEVYTGVMSGHLMRFKNGKWDKIVQTGRECDGDYLNGGCGRPLGLRFEPSGKLLVADGNMGLLRVDVDKKTVEKLLPRHSKIDGSDQPLNLVDDVDVASKDGSIYISDGGQHSELFFDYIIDLLGEPTGRLIKYNPKTKKTEVLASGIRFANGVQLSRKEDFVLVCETGLARVLKHHLTGPKTGKTEVFIDGLPGYPDNIRSNGKGGFYVSLVLTRPEKGDDIEKLAALPWARKLLIRFFTILAKGLNLLNSYVPHPTIGKAVVYAKSLGPFGDSTVSAPKNVIIVEVDESGAVLGSLQNQDGKISHISEASVGPKYTYFGSPFMPQLWRIKTEYI